MKIILTLIAFLTISFSFSQSYPDNCLDSLKIPDAITPNADGINDVFQIYFPCPPQEFELSVYNRWGEEILNTADFKFQWQGHTKKGQELPSGVYIYKLNYTFNDKDVEKKGQLTIIR